MRTPSRLAASVIGLVAVVSFPSSAPAEPAGPQPLAPALDATVAGAVATFAEAGLDLPPVTFVSGESEADCDGYLGLHRRHDGVSEITLCIGTPSNYATHLVLHELGHAWAATALADERRAAFQELQGWSVWRDYESAAWRDNGTEQAAEIIAWGLDEHVLRPAIDVPGCDQLRAGFEALTGAAPLHGRSEACAAPATRTNAR